MEKKSGGIKKQIINILFLLVLIGLTVYALAGSNKELSFSNIKEFVLSCNPWLLIPAFVCMLVFVIAEGLSVHIITAQLGYRRPLYSSIVYSTADIYYSAITPGASGGQPASAFYMIKDGIDGGTASLSLVFNLVAYTSAILVIAVAAFAIDGALFLELNTLSAVLVVAGIAVQLLLLTFFILCMRCHRLVLKAGNGIIRLLSKVRIIRKTEKWMGRFAGVVEKYASGYGRIKKSKGLFLKALALNVIQRVSQILVACFVCFAAGGGDFARLFVMQAFVLIGYNSIPLPGGVGAYEYLYLNIFGLSFGTAFVTSSMMVSRAISYYLCMIICGIATLVYHISVTNRRKTAEVKGEINTDGENNEITE